LYEYRCTIVDVVDGDTVHALVDLGLDESRKLTLRLNRINTPEMGTVAGAEAKTRLIELLEPGDVILRTIKDRREKYGRYLAELDVAGINVNDRLLEEGFAVPYPA
jgi:endonuclease YncB( thermonuclease family)